jgi:hypothetical protein
MEVFIGVVVIFAPKMNPDVVENFSAVLRASLPLKFWGRGKLGKTQTLQKTARENDWMPHNCGNTCSHIQVKV